MSQNVHWPFSGFLIIAAVCLSGGLLAIPELMSGQAELLSQRSATLLETCLGIDLLFLLATIGAVLGRVSSLEREVEKLKAMQPTSPGNV